MTTTDISPSDVLIVNHSPAISQFVSDALADLPYRISMRSSLTEPDADFPSGQKSDLIILDYMWWADIDDIWATLERIRSNSENGDVPIILLSNRTHEVVRVESRLKDLQISVVYKPIDTLALRSAVVGAFDVDTRHSVGTATTADIRILRELNWNPGDRRYLFPNMRLAQRTQEVLGSDSHDPSSPHESPDVGTARQDRVLRIRAHADLCGDVPTEAPTDTSDHVAIKQGNLENEHAQSAAAGSLDPLSG